jgi:hypothetical protein
MDTNKNIQDDNLKDEAPNLFSINKENPFGVPEIYFKKLPDEINAKCSQQKEQQTIRNHNFYFRRSLIPLAIAASVIFIFVFISNNDNKNNVADTTQYAGADVSGAAKYLENLIDNNDLDESLIISELVNDDTTKSITKTVEDINKLNNNPVVMKDSLNNVTLTEDDIIQYMIEEYGPDDF